jgi:hypothetical protein
MAPIGCQNFFSPFLVTAYTRCVGRALAVWVVMVLSFRFRARPHGGLDARFKAETYKRGCHKLSDPQRQRLRGVRTPAARSCTTPDS